MTVDFLKCFKKGGGCSDWVLIHAVRVAMEMDSKRQESWCA